MSSSKFLINVDARFSNVEQLCAEVQDWDLRFQPLHKSAGKTEIARMIRGSTVRFDCAYARFYENIDQRGSAPSDKFTFTIAGKSLQNLWWRGTNVSAGDVLVFSPGSELHSISASDFEVHLLAVSQADVLLIAERCGLKMPKSGSLPNIFQAPETLIIAARTLLCKMTNTPDQINEDALDLMAENLIQCWLSQAGIVGRRQNVPATKLVMEDFLEAISDGNLAGIQISEFCDRRNVSRRSLELLFQERFGTGPSSFLKTARLTESRRKLLTVSNSHRTVGDVMSQTGFSHVGQFATDYRRMFGELPSETLRR
ncbi:MAG: helix-turn-helix domain-containing protein [Roseibium sp.]